VIVQAAVVGLLVVQNRFGSAYYQTGAFESAGQGPHNIGLSSGLALVLLLVVARRQVSSGVAAALAVAVCAGVIASLARSVLLGFLFVLAGALTLVPSRKARSRFVVVAMILAMLVVAWQFRIELGTRLENRNLNAPSVVRPAASGRFEFWLAVARELDQNPRLLATGGGVDFARATIEKRLGLAVWAHNDALELAGVGGVSLLLAYVAYWVWAVRTIVRAGTPRLRRLRPLLLGGLLCFLTVSLTNSALFGSAASMMALILGYIVGMSVAAKTASETQVCKSPTAELIVSHDPLHERSVGQ
jgi:O-antigen ligase